MITPRFVATNAHPPLTTDELHLWRWPIPTVGELADQQALLSPSERERVARLHQAQDRRARIISRAVMRRLLGQYLDIEPTAVPIRYGPLGRPHLDQQHLPQSTALNFNLSHSGGWVAMVVGLAEPLGIDIELPRARPPSARLLRRICSPRERAVLAALPAAERHAAFYRAWTRKEAILKATGGSIFHASASIDVSLREAHQPPVYQAARGSHRAWQLFHIGWGPIVGAIAVDEGSWELRHFSFEPTTAAPKSQ